MAMPVSVLKVGKDPPPDMPMMLRKKRFASPATDKPPLAKDGNVVSIWQGTGESWIKSDEDRELVSYLKEALLPPLATGADAGVKDDSELYTAALQHLTPVGFTSIVKLDGADENGIPHRVDTINLAGNQFDPRRVGCTWVGYTKTENEVAWALAATRYRKRHQRSVRVRERHNKTEHTAPLYAKCPVYRRPPTPMWLLRHPEGHGGIFRTPWPNGPFVMGKSSDEILHDNKVKLWGEWFSSLSGLDRALLSMSRLELSNEQVRDYDMLLLEFVVWLDRVLVGDQMEVEEDTSDDIPWSYAKEDGHASTGHPGNFLDMVSGLADGQASVFPSLETVLDRLEPELPEKETEKGNQSEFIEPTPYLPSESVLEGEFEVVAREDITPHRELQHAVVPYAQDEFFVNLRLGGPIVGNLKSPQFLKELREKHVPTIRAIRDTLVTLIAMAEKFQHGELKEEELEPLQVNMDGLLDDASAELIVERVVASESETQRQKWRGLRYEDGNYHHNRFHNWSVNADLAAERGRQERMKHELSLSWHKYMDEVAKWNAKQEHLALITTEVDALQKIGRVGRRGVFMKECIRNELRGRRQRWYAAQFAKANRVNVIREMRFLNRMANPNRLKSGWKLRLKRTKMRLKHKLLTWWNRPGYEELPNLVSQPPSLRASVADLKTEVGTNESAQIITLGSTEVLRRVKEMRASLIEHGVASLTEIVQHEALVRRYFPEELPKDLVDSASIKPVELTEIPDRVKEYRQRVAARRKIHSEQAHRLIA